MIYFLFIFSLATASAADQATLVLKNGTNRTGEIVFADDHQIRLKIALGDQGDATATVSIPRSALESIDFESDPSLPPPTHPRHVSGVLWENRYWLPPIPRTRKERLEFLRR